MAPCDPRSETCADCGRPARGAVLVRTLGGARWEPRWTCELEHRAGHLAGLMRESDPGAMVLAFANAGDIAPCWRRR